jgi:hypothetical protein
MHESFEMALKVPGNTGYIFTPRSECVLDINEWISSILAQESWDGWFLYNDFPPSQHIRYQYTTQGHCKGMVLWNTLHVIWFIHSVPEWPDKIPTEELPPTVFDEGHSFACWKGSIDMLCKIECQIDLMHARVYAGKRSNITHESSIGTLQRIKLDSMTDHVAKNKLWGRDVYPALGKCHVQSRASLDDTTLVHNVTRVNLPGWDSLKDHSLWAVGSGWVCVGDVRRGESEFIFGGGCLVCYNEELALKIQKLLRPVKQENHPL